MIAAGLLLAAAGTLKILFVGNSLVYVNELPVRVAAMGRGVGAEITVASVAYPNYGLGDHWAKGDAPREIRDGAYDVVVLQQGPTSQYESRKDLLYQSYRFAKLIREHGGRPAVMMSWPDKTRAQDWDRVLVNHRDAADAVKAVVLPVGAAWRTALARDASIGLYGPDGFHPSPLGSDLAALVIASALLERPPSDFPLPGVPEPAAQALREVASEALRSFPSRGAPSPSPPSPPAR